MKTGNRDLKAPSPKKERAELRAVSTLNVASLPEGAIFWINGVQLRRSFDMTLCGQTLRFCRVLGPAGHPKVRCINSDLSELGLQEWGIL